MPQVRYNAIPMAATNDLIALVRLKQQQITKLQAELDEVRQLLSGHQPQMKPQISKTRQHRPRRPGRPKREKRIETSTAWSAEILGKVGHPLHADDLVKRIKADYGREVAKQTLVSSLSRLVKLGERFVRTGPNTFGLVGMEKSTK